MIGALLGKYRVLSKLGEGGMGVVYLGRHEGLGHSVVVKVLQPELSRDTEMVQRFFNEAQAATAIRNLGIVQVFDFGITPDGCAYFVMELLEGQSLAARLRERRLEPIEFCRIGRQIANVLQAAHARGITHRDLKPENLFLVHDAEAMGGERVKVLDFGIAKLAGQVHAAGVRTRTGMIMGTPHYMSPEQCRGAGTVDARSDIYSLGCILFEMSCGRPPFVAEGAGELLGAHQFIDAPHPQSLAPDIPSGLATLIAQMLAKQPDARPQTMAAVSQTLGEILQTLGAPPRAPTPLPVPSPPPSRPAPPAPSSVPASTTLGASAGMTDVRASNRTRWFPFVVGGVIVAVAVPTLVLGLATKEPSSPQRPTSQDAAAILPADAGTSDAAQIAVSPPIQPTPEEALPTRPTTPVAASPGPPPSQGGKVEKVSLKTRAASEAKAAPGNQAFETAMRDRNLKRAKAELDAIPTTTPDYPRLRQTYEAFEASVITDLVAQLRATSDDCEKYNEIIQQAQASQPPDVAAEAMRRIKCTPAVKQAPDCDHEQLADRANSYYAAGKLVTAIDHYQAAWDCKPEPRYAEKAFLVACNIPSEMKAKLFWRRMSPSTKPRVLAICVRNGITEEMLNTP